MNVGDIGTISIIMEMNRNISTIMEISDRIKFGKRVVAIKYKETIIELVEKIQSEHILKRIYKFVLYLYTHETGG